jgi:putative transcriptional regulator
LSLRHHPSADILADYAAGTMEPGFALVVGAHVEGCAQCRAQVRGFEAVSGEALRGVDDAVMDEAALAKVLSRLEQSPARSSNEPDRRPLMQRLPLKPKKWVAPGVWVAAVDTPHAQNNRVYVLSVAPGSPTARHEHSGLEYCTVLKGAYRDEVGLFRAGDFAAAGDHLNHQPVIEGDEHCVCLFATEGRLKPQGILGRMAFAYADV